MGPLILTLSSFEVQMHTGLISSSAVIPPLLLLFSLFTLYNGVCHMCVIWQGLYRMIRLYPVFWRDALGELNWEANTKYETQLLLDWDNVWWRYIYLYSPLCGGYIYHHHTLCGGAKFSLLAPREFWSRWAIFAAGPSILCTTQPIQHVDTEK